MSRQIPGKVYTGPPTAHLTDSSTSLSLAQRLKPNGRGTTARQRESQSAIYGLDRDALNAELRGRRNEWDVVRDHHRFIRSSGDGDERQAEETWEERVAKAYESKLFKEFAMIDLKHYKSKRLALRWRTAPEVIAGLGESTCGSLRCKWHDLSSSFASSSGAGPSNRRIAFNDDPDDDDDEYEYSQREAGGAGAGDAGERGETRLPALKSFELPFVYAEAGERKEALVKVRLCPKCAAKLVWKPDTEKKNRDKDRSGTKPRDRDSEREKEREKGRGKRNVVEGEERERARSSRAGSIDHDEPGYRRGSSRRDHSPRSRSRSPSRRNNDHADGSHDRRRRGDREERDAHGH